MTYKKEIYEDLINSLDIGSSVAEQDRFLEIAKVDTPVLNDLIADRVDLILGMKGSGKTSLFRLVIAAAEQLEKYKILIASGVEPTGNAVFAQFKEEFDKFSEEDFDNFWMIYIINLVYNTFIAKPEYQHELKKVSKERSDFINESIAIGVPQVSGVTDFRSLVNRSLEALRNLPNVKKISASMKYDAKQPGLFEPKIEAELVPKQSGKKLPIYTTKLAVILNGILEKTGYKIWILLDRLDIVFEHGSALEFKALRGLLKAYEGFQASDSANNKLRIKIFLRYDLFDFFTSPETYKRIYKHRGPHLSALTHITARATKDPLHWNREQIQLLMLKRLFLSASLRSYFNVSISDLEKEEVRNRIWEILFGGQVDAGSKKPDSMSWIYTRLRDATLYVTPRAAMDFLDGMISAQKKSFLLNKVDQEHFFSSTAIKNGIIVSSSQKYRDETKNEYPGIVKYIEKLREKKARIPLADIQKLLGGDYESVLLELTKIGLASRSNGDIVIANIFRPALNIRPQL